MLPFQECYNITDEAAPKTHADQGAQKGDYRLGSVAEGSGRRRDAQTEAKTWSEAIERNRSFDAPCASILSSDRQLEALNFLRYFLGHNALNRARVALKRAS
jgi:hypothetical protein